MLTIIDDPVLDRLSEPRPLLPKQTPRDDADDRSRSPEEVKQCRLQTARTIRALRRPLYIQLGLL